MDSQQRRRSYVQNPCDILSGKKMCFQIDHAVGREHHKGYTCKDNEKRKRKFLFSYEKEKESVLFLD